MLHIFNVWKTQNKTIKDSGYVLKGKVSLFGILKLKIFQKYTTQEAMESSAFPDNL